MSRTTCKGKGGGGSAYDPQIGQAAQATAATAARAQKFAEDYYRDVITPLLQQQNEASLESQGKLGELYDLNAAQMRQAQDRYNQYGIPAENRYYETISKYSEPEEMERQAQAALGDVRQAEANQALQMRQRFSALGIDPTSPAAISASADAAVMNAANEASAMNRARNAARLMGLQLTSDAANFGRGGQSGILQFGQAAQGNTLSGANVANQALAGANASASVPLAGYNAALQGYGSNMAGYSKLGAADLAAQAANNPFTGLGALAGTLLGKMPLGGV